jgi:nitrogen fixation/metabolism regulation signal transduction histidine kinase
MAQAFAVEATGHAESLASGRKGLGLKWRIMAIFSGTILLVGILVIAVVQYLMTEALRNQLNRRAFAIANNLSDVAAGNVLGKNLLALHAQVTKYALLEEVAYTFIADGQGKVIAHSLGNFPRELQGTLSLQRPSVTRHRTLTLQGRPVYETQVPLLEGQLGAVHVGIWGDAVEEEIQRALLPLIGAVGIVFVLGMLVAALLARGISRPILRLTEIANNMSKGDLDTAVGIHARAEIQELADSLERMRASLRAAMLRLSRGHS